MGIEELLELLEIEHASELVYFEQFAELIENDADISLEAITSLVEDLEPEVLTELVGGYFEELLNSAPDDQPELFTLLQTIATTLSSLAQGSEDEELAHACAEEIYKFRNWFLYDGRVLATDVATGEESEQSVFEALANVRLQRHVDNEYSFDFEDALDYPLEEYIVSLASLMEDGYGDGDEGEDADYMDEGYEED